MKIVITDADTVFDGTVKADIFQQYGQVVAYGLTGQDTLFGAHCGCGYPALQQDPHRQAGNGCRPQFEIYRCSRYRL